MGAEMGAGSVQEVCVARGQWMRASRVCEDAATCRIWQQAILAAARWCGRCLGSSLAVIIISANAQPRLAPSSNLSWSRDSHNFEMSRGLQRAPGLATAEQNPQARAGRGRSNWYTTHCN